MSNILPKREALNKRGGGRTYPRTSRQWRFVPRQATFWEILHWKLRCLPSALPTQRVSKGASGAKLAYK